MSETDWRTRDPDGDWSEDFGHENGNYLNGCRTCEKLFMGHKRRTVCRVCYWANTGYGESSALDDAINLEASDE